MKATLSKDRARAFKSIKKSLEGTCYRPDLAEVEPSCPFSVQLCAMYLAVFPITKVLPNNNGSYVHNFFELIQCFSMIGYDGCVCFTL